MSADGWRDVTGEALAQLHENQLYRTRRQLIPLDATHVQWEGRRYVNFASNDYLGLTHHPRVIEASCESLRQSGAGSGGSALICGYTPAHTATEREIAQWKGTESSILLPSGYQANLAAVQTLDVCAQRSGKRIRFLLDKLAHASLLDAVRGSGSAFRILPHNHLKKLDRLLQDSPEGELQVVVSESIFSMNGDAADLAGLAELKEKYGFVLLLDEAHCSGVYGPGGSGLPAERGLPDLPDVVIATLSKAIGCIGGAVCGSKDFCEAVVNFARAYIYSTSPPPHVAATASAAIRVMRDEPQRQTRLRQLCLHVRNGLKSTRFEIPQGDSPIIPVIVGSASAALKAAQFLRSKGIMALAIRPPTVPRGRSRVRISLCSEHTHQEIAQLIHAIQELSLRITPPAAASR